MNAHRVRAGGAAAARRRRRPAPRAPAAGRAATTGAGNGSSGRPPGPGVSLRGHEPDDVEQPVGVGAQPQVGGAGARAARRRSAPRCAAAASAYRCAAAGRRSAPRAAARSPGRPARARPTSGSSSSRGSSTSMASTSWRTRELAQRPGPLLRRRQEVGDHHGQAAPARRAVAAARSARRGRPRARPGRAVTARSPAAGPAPPCGRPRAGQAHAVVPPPVPTTAPIRLPPRTVRWVDRGRAASARSRLSTAAVPKSRLADRSTRQPGLQLPVGDGLPHVRHVVRAVTGQSIRRTSSPGRYSRDSPASLPGPGSRPR